MCAVCIVHTKHSFDFFGALQSNMARIDTHHQHVTRHDIGNQPTKLDTTSYLQTGDNTIGELLGAQRAAQISCSLSSADRLEDGVFNLVSMVEEAHVAKHHNR